MRVILTSCNTLGATHHCAGLQKCKKAFVFDNLLTMSLEQGSQTKNIFCFYQTALGMPPSCPPSHVFVCPTKGHALIFFKKKAIIIQRGSDLGERGESLEITADSAWIEKKKGRIYSRLKSHSPFLDKVRLQHSKKLLPRQLWKKPSVDSLFQLNLEQI